MSGSGAEDPELRERVFAAIVAERDRNPNFAKVMDQLGFFTACDFIDGVVAAMVAAQQTDEP